MKKLGFFLFFLLQISVGIAQNSRHEILSFIQQKSWPCSGELLNNSDGFLYVKVSDEYVHELVRFIQDDGFEEPPYFGQLYSDGAHISVIYSKELEERSPIQIDELHRVFDFKITDCGIFETPSWKGVEAVFVLLVKAPALDQLREKYGLPQDHVFHITIGIRRDPAAALAW